MSARNAPKTITIFFPRHSTLAEMSGIVISCHGWQNRHWHRITASRNRRTRAMLKKVVLLALPGVAPFEFGVICEVFGIDRSDTGGPTFEFTIATADPGRVPTNAGFDLVIETGLSVAADADLIAVPAHTTNSTDERILEVIREAEARGAWILSVCSGAFVLAEAGILNGRRATTHWMHSDRLAANYPHISVDPDVLFVEDNHVITSAGTAAGIDAALHLVRIEHGAAAANVIARRMVIPPQRDGGQAQYIPTLVQQECSDSLASICEWMLDNMAEDLSVDRLARKALMSSRTFARRFRDDMGTTPAAWLNRQRILRAQQLLETTDLGFETVAQQTGFGTAAVMRHHFLKVLQTTPTSYRRAFGARLAG
jgi:transcriptional regulator GlxA family with amidase domain